MGGYDVRTQQNGVRRSIGLVPQDAAVDGEGTSNGVTPRGLEFLDTFWKMKGFLEELGESRGS